MFLVVGALVVLGSVIYLLVTILSFMGQSGSLSTQLEDMKASLAHKENRLEEYRLRAEQLQVSVPALKEKIERYRQWIAAINRQKTQLVSQAQTTGKSDKERDAAIRRSLSAAQKRKV